ncbi:hypothetical protein FXO38_08247 [Capsicum annuum]|uniref:Uncharacterized protein n=1 Tax=Capsicum annuum TaxID=4072 RepID=A0A2G2Z7G3_CAPAN|nr:hypothetical protein FXO38_08247 [Capsicum annuum]KAF3685021.1 hypothetical protein FXO37_01027 [Capsicum annuum]PHT77946.1 hypothetical protein T459_15998 [Capsicum annuum]
MSSSSQTNNIRLRLNLCCQESGNQIHLLLHTISFFISGYFRGRFPSGGASGYRNYGVRGRGNYGGGRVYARDDFGERTEFNNRGGHRGWSSNRGGDGYQSYQRTDNPGGYVARTNHGGRMLNGTT